MHKQFAALPRGTASLNSLVAESIASIISIASIHYPNQLVSATASQSAEGPVGTALSCLLHPDTTVRTAASKSIRKVLCSATAADEKASSYYPTSLKILKALHGCLSLWSEQLEVAMRVTCNTQSAPATGAATPAGDEEVAAVGGLAGLRIQFGIPPASRIAEVLLLLSSAQQSSNLQTPSGQLISMFLLASAHPLVSESHTLATKLWHRIITTISAEERSVGSRLTEMFSTEDLCSAASKRVLTSVMNGESKLTRQAGHVAIYLLSASTEASGRSCVLHHIVPQLKARLISSGVAAVSDDEVDKFLNPLAAITAATAAVEIGEADIKITNADRKKDSGRSRRGGAFGGDFVEDEDWAEKVKKEKALKLALTKTSGQIGGTSVKLKELEDMRVRVQAIVDVATYALEAYHSMTVFSVVPSNGNGVVSDSMKLRAVVRSTVCQILPELMALLRCPLVSDKAFSCVLGQCMAIEEELLVSGSRDLADSIRITATVTLRPLTRKETIQGLYKEMLVLAAPVQRLLRTVQTHLSRLQSHSHQEDKRATKEHLLLPSTVHLLYPVLKGLLGMPTILPGCDFAFMVLDS